MGFRGLLLLLLITLGAMPSAHAVLLYLEAGAGASFLWNAQSAFPSMTQANSNIAPAWNGGLTFVFGNGSGPVDFHLGVKYRATSGNVITSTGFTNYQLMTVYPEFKVQIRMFYASIGLSPLIWKRQTNTYGFDGLSLGLTNWAYIAEVGLLYAWTPMFSIGASLTGQMQGPIGFFSPPLSPMPAVDAQLFMRFYFWRQNIEVGTGGSSKTEITPNEYKGWRYPGGWSK